MARVIFNKILYISFLLWLVISLTFIMFKLLPGTPYATDYLMSDLTKESLDARYLLDQPLLNQYWHYLKQTLSLDLGMSYSYPTASVIHLLKSGLPHSFRIGGLAFLLIILLGLPLGILAALYENSFLDRWIRTLTGITVTLPTFVIASLILYFFAGQLKWLPTFGVYSWKGYIGPILALFIHYVGVVIRMIRASMIDALGDDYILTLHANGIPSWRIYLKHALKKAILPILTYAGPLLAGLLTGSFVIETIFVVPGLARFFIDAIHDRDLPLLLGITLLYAILYITFMHLIDLVYRLLDPRSRQLKGLAYDRK